MILTDCGVWAIKCADSRTHWSLTRVQQRLVKTGGRVVKHARDDWRLLAKGRLARRVFGAILRRIWVLRGCSSLSGRPGRVGHPCVRAGRGIERACTRKRQADG